MNSEQRVAIEKTKDLLEQALVSLKETNFREKQDYHRIWIDSLKLPFRNRMIKLATVEFFRRHAKLEDLTRLEGSYIGKQSTHFSAWTLGYFEGEYAYISTEGYESLVDNDRREVEWRNLSDFPSKAEFLKDFEEFLSKNEEGDDDKTEKTIFLSYLMALCFKKQAKCGFLVPTKSIDFSSWNY